MSFHIKDFVRLHGLKNEEYNGTCGTIEGFNEAKKRWIIESFSKAKIICIKSENLAEIQMEEPIIRFEPKMPNEFHKSFNTDQPVILCFVPKTDQKIFEGKVYCFRKDKTLCVIEVGIKSVNTHKHRAKIYPFFFNAAVEQKIYPCIDIFEYKTKNILFEKKNYKNFLEITDKIIFNENFYENNNINSLVQMHYHRGESFEFFGQVKAAIAEYEKCLQLEEKKPSFNYVDNTANSYSAIGFCHRTLRNYKKAIKFYKKSYEIEPKDYILNNIKLAKRSMKSDGIIQWVPNALNDHNEDLVVKKDDTFFHRACGGCNKVCVTKNITLKKCARCLVTRYCSRECQLKDYPRHKVACKEYVKNKKKKKLLKI
jgi:tetratricopeptide (TPR) repeat protein